jgi:hypothetical protein
MLVLMLTLAQAAQGAGNAGNAANAAAGGFLALFASIWCFAIVVTVGHFVIFLIALIQILQRNMPATEKILWGAVSWCLPIIGPILWWTIGSKQNPPGGPPART